ncbi:hypothetical protein BL250_17470 [Erwinia sp. OLTSP20]|uniref:fimbrial protein n=1 Tax=unclassified Erwinia TaxID=2622719 RepID=UPI000C17FA53|nr:MULTISPECIES: fimbrial protein [unclassified Erwinia]PIJ48207.1 hypothetical protein BV501_17995 [Erwinia sp. OAMSP11]PIJ66746.1 hypothetical protein BK416_17460 [Erwinia sp. OLSSP12]PIJ78193.1 hypothetical protein BLD47_17340 [Erwinia sp. OLCASP19]PIJ79016.1 hypothetical protein BLD46_17540 [Erwinia sp. OLMTSP26]PIJ80028.1 hypothetical protein BLD49_17265 [Erwinia sp. OLMDSP33]
MKKTFLKMGLAVGVTLALVSGAQAANNATVNFKGQITPTTCDVTLNGAGDVDLGTWAKADFDATQGAVLQASKKVTSLLLNNCKGDDIPMNKFMVLKAESADLDPTLATDGLWGDTASRATGVGVQLEWKSGPVPTQKPLTSADNTIQITETNNTSAVNPADLVIKPVTVEAALKSTAANTALQAGNIRASLVFSAVYLYFSGCSGASVPAALLVQGAVASRRYGLWGVGAGEGHGVELRVTYGGRTRRVTPTENAFLLPPSAVGTQSVLPRLRIQSALAPGTRGGVRAALLFSMVYG